ncbi:MAG: ABC transporter permease [Hungatella sp.]|jgi:ABC-type uncharacterized transport system permease subunit|nr:ABC transporter permease [Hungatella sp.]
MPINVTLLAVVARVTTPIVLCASGGLYCQMAGTPNITLEGAMLMAAFTGVAGSYYTGSALAGLLCAIAGSMAVNLLFGFLHLKLGGEGTITGFAINSLCLGLTTFLLRSMFHVTGTLVDDRITGLTRYSVPVLKDIPVIQQLFTGHTLCTYFSWAFVILTYIIFYKTRYGMNVRACGENPGAVAAVGVSVQRIRWSTVLISGFMSGLAGAQISLGYLSMFSENMTSGRGFIALAAIMLSGGRPVAMFVAALLFGVAEGLSNQAQLTTVSSHLILTLPYLMVIVVLLMQPEQMRALKLRIKQMKG